MDTLQFGPLALPLTRLPGLAALFALLLGAALVSRGLPRLRAWSSEAALLAVIAARLAFVAVHWQAYTAAPLSVLYFWQGGFLPLAGAAAVLPYTYWRLRRDPRALLRAAVPLTAAGLALGLGNAAIQALKPPERPLPAVEVTTLDGRSETLRSHLGKPLVINLWASWCPPCRREMPMLVSLAAERQDVNVLLINQGETRQQVARYLQEVGLQPDAIRLDLSGRTSRALDVQAYPTTLVFDARGQMVFRRAGEVSRAVVSQGIARALRGD